jgi:hypothetical protein
MSTYPEITIEAWYTPEAGANTSWSMLAYFGDSVNGLGSNGYFMTSARGDDKSRAAISCGDIATPWASESGADGPELDDGLLHHMVSTLTATDITLYIDGVLISSTPLSATNSISCISPNFAYLAKGGYDGDPEWIGAIEEFNIYNVALSEAEIAARYAAGPSKPQPIILYYDDFDGPAGADVNGTTPDITIDGAVWSAGSNFDADGTVTYDNNSMGDSAYLPFVPQEGNIYKLSVKIDSRVSPFRNNANDWIGVGFTQDNASPELRFFDDSGVNNNPIYWAMSRTNEAVAPNNDQTFIGPKTAGGEATTTISADKIEIVLDTTAATWVVSWYYDDVLQRTVDVDDALKPNFQYVALTNARADGFIDDFTLTQLP